MLLHLKMLEFGHRLITSFERAYNFDLLNSMVCSAFILSEAFLAFIILYFITSDLFMIILFSESRYSSFKLLCGKPNTSYIFVFIALNHIFLRLKYYFKLDGAGFELTLLELLSCALTIRATMLIHSLG